MPPEPEGNLITALLGAQAVQPAAAAQAQGETAGLMSVLLLIILVLVNGFFAASEIAVITLNDNKIRKMAEEGNKKAKRVLKLTQNSSRFLSTIQIGVTLAGFLTSASAAQSYSAMLTDWLMQFIPGSRSVIDGVATVIITLILSYFSLVFGELVPKKIAMQKAEALSFRFVGILQAVSVIFRPFISLLTVSTNLVLKLIGINPDAAEETVTEEEILMMVDAGEEKGVLDESAKDMISNIFDFNDATAVEAMTHRTDIAAVEDDASIQDVVDLSIAEGYSRIPLYHEDLDNILGIIYVKDLLKYVSTDLTPDVPLTAIMRPAFFVPESKSCADLFKEMTERKTQIAIIVDEYGGTEGLITMEDLLESIVGNIQDEYDHEEEEIHQMSENTYKVDGSTPIDEIEDLTGVTLPDSEYDTIAGLMMERLGRVPAIGEHPNVKIGRLNLTVLEVEDRRISRIMIEREPLPPQDLEDTEKEAKKDKEKKKNASAKEKADAPAE